MNKYRLGVLVAVLLVVLLSTVGYGENRLIRDDWFLLEQGSDPIGYSQDQVWETDEGYLFVSHTHMKVDFVGQISTYTEHVEVHTDGDFFLTSLLHVTDSNGNQTRREGAFTYSAEESTATIVHTDPRGEERESFWSWDEEKPFYITSSFLEKVRQQHGFKIGAEHSATVWDLVGYQPGELVVTTNSEQVVTYGGQEIPVYDITYKTGEQVLNALIDETNRFYWVESVGSGFVMNRIEREEIPELKALTADALIVPANIFVNHPYRSTSSLIEVLWSDVDFQEFDWEDNRQKLLEHETDEQGNQQVLLEITRDLKDYTGAVTLPVADPIFADFLGSEDYIQPDLPEIKAITAELLDGIDDGWQAVQNFVDWTFNFIEAQNIIETLTTAEILAGQTGKCTEYAVLFAALARNAGIPTRLALGERYQGNIWVGHMWNEVWLGEWVTVDPSHNQVNPDALLIKFVDSDTLMGTQVVRRGLIGKLGIIIESVEVPDLKGVLEQTGIIGSTYHNAEYNCSVEAPEGWAMVETEDQGMPLLIVHDQAGSYSAMLLMMSLPPGVTAEQIISNRVTVMPGYLPDFELQYQQQTEIAGLTGSVAGWTYEDATTIMQENQLIIDGDVGYLWVLSSSLTDWEVGSGFFQEILDSFGIH